MCRRFRPVIVLAGGIVGIVLTLAAGGCWEPIAPNREVLRQYPQIHLATTGLQRQIYLREPIVNRVGDGQLQVVVPVRNLENGELNLEYQYRFLNNQGVQVEETSGWNTLRLPDYGSMAQIQFTSLTAQAANFDLDIRTLQVEH